MKLFQLPSEVQAGTTLPLQNRPGTKEEEKQPPPFGMPVNMARWTRFLVSVLLAIVVPVLLTEALESLAGIPEQLEWLFHSVILMAALAPVFYFLWLRPLSIEIAERARAEGEIRRLSRQAVKAGEEAHRRLARDLHDDFGQRLIALKMQVDSYLYALGSQAPSMANEYRQVCTIVDGLTDDLRRVLLALRPPLLDDLGLVPAIEAHLADLKKLRPDLEVQLLVSGTGARLPSDLETALFRVCQEALTNILRHAQAKRVEIRLTGSFPTIILIIEDDGVGFDPQTARDTDAGYHYGLVGIRERVAAVGGWVKVMSTPDRGTRLRVEVPLPARG